MITHKMAAVALAMVLAGPAMAQDLVSVGQVGVWEILVDPSVGNGCLINAAFQDGSDVRIGFDLEARTGYLLALNEAWEGIEDGETYAIEMDIDGEIYEGEATGIIIDDMPGADIAFDSVDFLMDIATKQTLTLSNASGPVMSIDLTDSDKALEAAIDCQEQQG